MNISAFGQTIEIVHITVALGVSSLDLNFTFPPGRYDLTLPEVNCSTCSAHRCPGVTHIHQSDHWPATASVATGAFVVVEVSDRET